MANLDVTASLRAAGNEAEIRFAEAISFLAAGDFGRAESAFVAIGADAADLAVTVASQMMLATALMHERKWVALAQLSKNSRLPSADQQNIAGLERWGKVFASVEAQLITFAPEPVSLPLAITAVGTPTVRVRINGKEYQFWVDTGSSITVLSSKVAADCGVEILGPDVMVVGTFAGVAPVRPALLKRIDLGPISIANTPAVVMDAALMRVRATGERVPREGLWVDGIIGWDLIRQFDVSLNYDRATMTLRRPEALGTRGTSLQNLTWLGKPLVELRTSTGGMLHFTLDTGSQASFVNASIVEEAGIFTRSLRVRVFGIGKTEGTSVRAVPRLRVDFGGRSVLMTDLIVFAPSCSGILNCDGILGSDIAQFGTLRIDATNGIFSIGGPTAD